MDNRHKQKQTIDINRQWTIDINRQWTLNRIFFLEEHWVTTEDGYILGQSINKLKKLNIFKG